ncbi:sigma-70 family RNA polymerase sigma factor [Planctomycetaceae bacterium SH139]
MLENTEGSVTYYMNQLREGNRDATEELWQRFYSRLVRLAHNRMKAKFRRVTSEEDVATIAIAECFKSLEEGRFPDLEGRGDLWALLALITERRALNEIRRQTSQKAGGGKVHGESIFLKADETHPQGINGIPGKEPTPEYVDQFGITVSELLAGLNDQLRQIAVLKMQGYTNKEISKQVKVSIATVERKLAILREKLSQDED